MNALVFLNGMPLAAVARRLGEIEVQGVVEFTGHELGVGFEPPSCRA